MTAPTIPPAGQNPASPGQRQAARDHVTQLRQHGWTYRSIAAAAALSPDTVHALATGRRRAQPATATAVLTVTRRILSGSRLDAGGTRLRLRALHVMGHGSARIARAAGAHPRTIRQLVRGDARTVSPQLRHAIIAVYEAWWDKRAPTRTRSERAAATAARKRAIAGNWCAAAALDDDLLDTPGYRPRYGWKPATGTGTAPDIHPPTLRHRRRTADDPRHRRQALAGDRTAPGPGAQRPARRFDLLRTHTGAAPLRARRYTRSSGRQRHSGTRRPHPHRAIGPRVSLRPGLLVPPVPARTGRELPHRRRAVLRLGNLPAADDVADRRPPGLSGGLRGIPQRGLPGRRPNRRPGSDRVLNNARTVSRTPA